MIQNAVLSRFADFRLAFFMLPDVNEASIRFVLSRMALSNTHSFSTQSSRSAPVKFDPEKSTVSNAIPEKSRPCKSSPANVSLVQGSPRSKKPSNFSLLILEQCLGVQCVTK